MHERLAGFRAASGVPDYRRSGITRPIGLAHLAPKATIRLSERHFVSIYTPSPYFGPAVPRPEAFSVIERPIRAHSRSPGRRLGTVDPPFPWQVWSVESTSRAGSGNGKID